MEGPYIVGPGSQPTETDGAELDILQLPNEMETFSLTALPEPEDVSHLREALAVLDEVQAALKHSVAGEWPAPIDVNGLDAANRELVDQVMGEGEVSIVVEQGLMGQNIGMRRIQESVLAGVWRIMSYSDDGELVGDLIEVGAIPSCVQQAAFATAAERIELIQPLPPGVINAPSLFAEINDKCQSYRTGTPSHVINLTLLPQSEADLGFLQQQLGAGCVSILSRGYGNCRITSTGTQSVWWVQYFNSQDKNILNSLEITDIPSVACAAREDLEDSCVRLAEILEIYQ